MHYALLQFAASAGIYLREKLSFLLVQGLVT